MCVCFFSNVHHSLLSFFLSPEHKNMPLEDALGLVDRDFEHYLVGVREGRIPPRRSTLRQQQPSSSQQNSGGKDVPQLLAKLAADEMLSHDQLQTVISSLQKQIDGPQNSKSIN